MIYLNYESVIEKSISNSHADGASSSGVTYRELTIREKYVYSDALYRLRTEESKTKSKGK
jgi:hypothetical protein